MRIAYGNDSASLLRVLDTGMYIVLIVLPWLMASLVLFTVWVSQFRTQTDDHKDFEFLDFGVLVMAGYQSILSQSS